MAGNRPAAKATAKKAAASPVGTRTADPMEQAHPLVGVAGIAEQVGAPGTAEEHRRAMQKEYGQYVAVQAITHGGALAYNVNDPVPASNVAAWDYLTLGLVKRVGTVAAQQAAEDSTNDADMTDPEAPVD